MILACHSHLHNICNQSPLPLTDPHDAVPHAHRSVHRCQCHKLVTDTRSLEITSFNRAHANSY